MTNVDDRWRDCPQGELTRLGSRLRGRRRRRTAARAGGGLAVLLICVGLWSVATRPRDNTFAGITCTRVVELAMAYGEGSLEPKLREQVQSHLEQCPPCHERYREMGLIAQLVPERWRRVIRLAWLDDRDPARDPSQHSQAG